MRPVLLLTDAFKDYVAWAGANSAIFQKINELIKEIQRTPFEGKGKPEPLKGNLKGSWSRRINQEHRLVYAVNAETVTIITCHGHYE